MNEVKPEDQQLPDHLPGVPEPMKSSQRPRQWRRFLHLLRQI
ncbi:MAG: hypothetical protein SGI89_06045 [bacterium]|nr:hypothetical protein [bacterium]